MYFRYAEDRLNFQNCHVGKENYHCAVLLRRIIFHSIRSICSGNTRCNGKEEEKGWKDICFRRKIPSLRPSGRETHFGTM